MARGKRYKHITIHPAQGGALIGAASDDVPITKDTNYLSSSANYTQKLNFRRETDGELRREGWELFNPQPTKTVESWQWGNKVTFDALDSEYPIRAIHQFQGDDGTPVLIAIAGPKVWRLFAGGSSYAMDYSDPTQKYAIDSKGREYWSDESEEFYWKEIYTFDRYMDAVDENGEFVTPMDGGAYRWEVVDVQNHCIINNGVDLPIVYKSSYERAVPLYSLRENGVISVGTISTYQDRLFCGDLTTVVDGFDVLFTEYDDPYGWVYDSPLYGRLKTQRYQYRMMYSAEGEPKLFNAGIISGDAVVMESGGLPGTLTVDPLGRYEFNPTYNFKIGGDGSMYEMYSTGAFQGSEAYTVHFTDTIKTVDEKLDSLLISGIFLGTYEDNTLPAKLPLSFTNDANLEYRFVNSDNEHITFVDPATAQPLSAGDYTVVLRPYAEQLRSPASVREFSQDGSRILKMVELSDKLVAYRDTGFFFISKTNSAENPFAIEPRYEGGRVADFRHTITLVNGDTHIFMGNSGIYSINRSSSEPQPVQIFELGPPFWQYVPPDLSEYVYSIDNPVTREVFINCPNGFIQNSAGDYLDERSLKVDNPRLNWSVLAYDYIQGTLSEIDASFTSAAFIRKPKLNRVGPDEAWFVMGIHQASDIDRVYIGTQYREDPTYGGTLVRYGYGPPKAGESAPYRVYNRIGYGYESKIKSGLIDFGNSFSDKELRSYVLELSSKYDVTPVKVRISKTSAPQGTEEVETMDSTTGTDYVILNDIRDENMIPIYSRSAYFRDELTVEPLFGDNGDVYAESGYAIDQTGYVEGGLPYVKDNPIKIVGRTFEVSGVDTRATTQAYNQG